MELSKKAINEFKQIYLKLFGVQLSDKEATEKGKDLIQFLLLINFSYKHKK